MEAWIWDILYCISDGAGSKTKAGGGDVVGSQVDSRVRQRACDRASEWNS